MGSYFIGWNWGQYSLTINESISITTINLFASDSGQVEVLFTAIVNDLMPSPSGFLDIVVRCLPLTRKEYNL